MMETKNKYSLGFQYSIVSKEESCVLLNQMLFAHREKEQQVSNQSPEMYLYSSKDSHMHAQLSALP
jgi:hypothetical protein